MTAAPAPRYRSAPVFRVRDVVTAAKHDGTALGFRGRGFRGEPPGALGQDLLQQR